MEENIMKNHITLVSIVALVIGLLTVSGIVYAQTEYPITISLDGTSFLPNISNHDKNPPDVESRQIDIIINFKTNDPDLINTKINALGTVYDSDGNEVAEMTYKNGFEILDEGSLQFTKTVDESIEDATINIHLTDLDKEEQLSNELKVNVSAINPIDTLLVI